MSSSLITLTFTSTYNPLNSFSVTFQRTIQGAKGDSYTFEGAWAAGTYAEFSVVSHSNAIWAALRSTAVEPSAVATSDWALVADFSGATDAAALAQAWAAQPYGEDVAGATPGSRSSMHYATLAAASQIASAASAASASSSAGTATTQAGIAATQAAAALVSRNAADADAIATAADRIQTGLDRIAASASATSAGTSASSASGSASTAQTLLDSTTALALTVASNATIAAANAASAGAVSQTNLSASQRSIEYSTSKLSASASISASKEIWNLNPRLGPVGDWRDKVSGVSWMLESLGTSTRGTQARFPAIGYVSGTATLLSVSNQDGITGDLWKSWVVAGCTMVGYAQGIIFYAGTGGAYFIDLIADRVYRRSTSGLELCNNQNVATYNQGTATFSVVDTAQTLASNTVYWISAAVAPLTPVNPARCGLPTPFLAINNTTSVNIFRWDGAKTTFTGNTGKSAFDQYGVWVTTQGVHQFISWVKLLSATTVTQDAALASLLGTNDLPQALLANAYGSNSRLRRFMWDRGNYANSLHADINRSYNSGWQNGAQKVTIAESSALLSTPSATELLTNGAFTIDLTGWTSLDAGTAVSVWDAGAGGRMSLPRPDGTNVARRTQLITTIVGQAYKLTYTVSGATMSLQVGTTSGGATLLNAAAAVGSGTLYFIATTTTTYVTALGASNGTSPYLEDISVTGNVISDRSYTATGGVSNSLVITGTLTRAVVASGAELAMWQGFSAANYGRAAYASNLGFDTADFIVQQTVVHGATATAAQKTFWDFANPGGGGAYYRLETNASGFPQFVISDGTNTATATGSKAIPANSIAKIVGVRRTASTRIEVYVFVNGELYDFVTASTSAVTLTLSNTSAVLRLGCRADGTLPFDTASIGFTLGGVSPVAPLREFITSAAQDEYQMHLAGAKILLQGGTNVQGIANDDASGILYASKSAGGTDRYVGLVNLGALLSTGGTNLISTSAFVDTGSWSATRATLGARANNGPSSWGNDLYSWAISEDATAANSHFISAPSATLTAASYVFAMPVKLGTRTWALLQMIGGSNPALYCNLSTGANGSASGGATALTPVSLGGGWYLFQFTFTGTAAGYAGRFYAAEADADITMNGDGGASPALLIGKPILKLGSTALTAADYVYGLSGSDNHESVAANDNGVTIVTANGVDQFLPSLTMRRELANGRDKPVYDPTKAEWSIFTTNATVTDIATIPVPEGKAIRFRAEVEAFQYGGAFTERAFYTVQGIAQRDYGGNVVVTSNTTTQGEVTSTQDCTASADTTAQAARIRGTGKAAIREVWHTATDVWDSGHGGAV